MSQNQYFLNECSLNVDCEQLEEVEMEVEWEKKLHKLNRTNFKELNELNVWNWL